MVEVSIICLIYKAPELADFFYKSLMEYTPMIKDGRAEFFFVANDPTKELVKHLKKKKYPHILNFNKKYNDEELFAKGYSKPEYIGRVYKGYNAGIKHAKGEKIVLVNSDNFFSKDWLENLLKYLSYDSIICSTLVEPGHSTLGVFPQAKCKNFGTNIETFNNNNFQTYANLIKKTGLKPNGAYMPCLLYKDIAIMAGLYPEGNIAGNSVEETVKYGDEYFFQKLSSFNIKHYTSKDSIVYHLKEGEKDIKTNDTPQKSKSNTVIYKYTMNPQSKYLVTELKPEINHYKIMKKLLSKITSIIYDYNNEKELEQQISNNLKQTYLNKEIIVIKNKFLNSKIEKKYNKQVKFKDYESEDKVYRIILSIYKSEGAFIYLNSPDYKMENNLFEMFIDNMNKKNQYNILSVLNNGINQNPNKMLIPKDLLIINTPNFLNEILSDKFIRIDMTKFNGDYLVDLLDEKEVK